MTAPDVNADVRARFEAWHDQRWPEPDNCRYKVDWRSAKHAKIDCLYCCRPGTRLNVHKGGWQLAKNRPFAYVCPDCTHRETAHLSENSRG